MIEIDNAPWFVAKDVLDALGYSGGAHANTMKKLNPDEVFLKSIKKGVRPMSVISESGLNKLIMRSDKPEAKAFQDWVIGTVLPSIRKDGGYIMGEDDDRPDGLRVLQGTLELPDGFP